MVKVNVTPQAEQYLARKIGDNKAVIRIFVDNEDCGCTGGIPALRLIDEPGKRDTVIESNVLTLTMHQSGESYYDDDELTLSTDDAGSSLRLSSASQYYSRSIRVLDGRKALA
ncbi:iron-sulfur cluster biosynthesis family protein [Paenibacillus sp. PK4536]|jgi:uncharacterized protein YqkB|uniref:iron-sulfur cluster biosynthesis family protein n=1 Tax=Paenibacillus TaxID=44249 RepID=UPI0010C01E53|nr:MULTISPECIES: iron-sulfur cluster biosynthesis family protein [Paenibacillus]TKJ92652.1 hypothetical protein PaeCFBP13512_04645 [Paenibacillus sp. CFBP13512]WIM38592.1 iron-sulfur cluster biosynthesis family protein [Paenibacillus sp. PK4536]CAJ1314727.1 Fe-S-biosyn domain-containing protein [Paenibacillus nuruki]